MRGARAPPLQSCPLVVTRSLRFAWLGLVLGLLTNGCVPPSETTQHRATIDASGQALVHAVAPGDNHHWSVDVTFRGASEGTYALLFTTAEPASREWFAIPANDPALRCAAARAKGCTLADGSADMVAVATVGPGGTGVLRTTFDHGAGGWFRVLRIEDGPVAAAQLDMRIVSEAMSKDEDAYRFTIEQVR